MRHLIRQCYSAGGYVFATKAVNIAREAGHKKIARLASNENPYPPSPEAVRMAEEALSGVNRYPDEHMSDLSDALKKYHGDFTFVTGVGMDGVIETVIRTLIKPGDRGSVSTPTFSFYNLAIQAQGGSLYISGAKRISELTWRTSLRPAAVQNSRFSVHPTTRPGPPHQ